MSAATSISMIVRLLFLFLTKVACNLPAGDFIFNGYLNLEGTASLDSQGLFTLTNGSSFSSGHAFYNFPLQFKNSTNGSVVSFSTTFIFAIRPLKDGSFLGHGISFVISPDKRMLYTLPCQYLGLFNRTNNGDSANHIVAVELDTFRNQEFNDTNHNHVGIDINSLNSVRADSAGYYVIDEHGSHVFKNLSLTSGNPMQVWVEYNGDDNQLNVTIFPINMPKPEKPLLSLNRDLSPYLLQQMYVGFTAATGRLNAYHYILGWSFKLNGRAQDIDLSSLPKLPMENKNGARVRSRKVVTLLLPIVGSCLLLLALISFAIFVRKRRMRRFMVMEVIEDWEVQYGPLRFSYQDLSVATKCFKENQFLGRGGFGQVYHGILPKINMQIAVKRIKSDSKQGMKEFVAEIATIGHLRHPKLVRLLGYCKKNDELFLVYDFMPNGSLDQFLYKKLGSQPKQALSWPIRLKIIKDVASGLLYLHEKWTQVVIHRDIKASNILIDSEFNARLGDFGLAKLYNHGTNALTTHVAGTLGYIAPELTRTGKPDTRTDVFAFGAFLLEVVCGRRPLEPGARPGQTLLVDWVLWCLEKGTMLEVVDQNLESKFEIGEVELVLRLGLLCSHAHAAARPSMSNVVKYLAGEVKLPDKLIDVLKSQDFVHGSCRVDDHINSNSIPLISNSEPFVSVGR